MSIPPSSSNGHTNGPADAQAASGEPLRKKPLIPPHIAWPGFVIALLLLSIGSAFQAFFAANSDGGAQVVEDYYDAAVRFDDEQAARAASDALGWTTNIRIDGCEGGLCAVELAVRDREGKPVTGLAGLLTASRPQDAAASARIPLAAKVEAEAPGVYRQLVPLPTDGLWDFAVAAHRGDERFLTTVRHEVSR